MLLADVVIHPMNATLKNGEIPLDGIRVNEPRLTVHELSRMADGHMPIEVVVPLMLIRENESRRWAPQWSDQQRAIGYAGWKKAVERTLAWVDVE